MDWAFMVSFYKNIVKRPTGGLKSCDLHLVLKCDYGIKCYSRDISTSTRKTSLEYILYLSVTSMLIIHLINKIICVCTYIIIHILVLMRVHVCTFVLSKPLWGCLSQLLVFISRFLCLVSAAWILEGKPVLSNHIWARNGALSQGWGRRSYQAFPGAVTVPPFPCSAAPTPRTKQPYWWWWCCVLPF